MTELARQIISLVDSGMSAREIADKTGASLATVHIYASRSGKRITGGLLKPVLYGKEEQIRELIESGVTYTEIGRMYGIDKTTVRQFCKKNGFERTEEQKKTSPQSIEEVIQKVNASGKGVEYVSGYVNASKPIIVRCKACGHEYTKRYDVIVSHPGGIGTCPKCRAEVEKQKREQRQRAEAEKAREREKREAERARAKAIAKARAEKEAERKRKARIHPCPVCGKTTDRPKYCSNRCQKRAYNKSHETARRIKIMKAMVDRDISIEGLFRRDQGRCHICGLHCNFEDYTVRDGAFIAGDWYPSIDHVIPLAKGGLHAWDNVKLAHMRCNSYKSDEVYPPPSA